MFQTYIIDKDKIDKLTFFKSLPKFFPDATTFYGGGSGLPVRLGQSMRHMRKKECM